MISHNAFGAAKPAELANPFARAQSGMAGAGPPQDGRPLGGKDAAGVLGGNLTPLSWFPFTVAASRGQVAIAARIARRTERAYRHLRKLFGVTPKFRLLVLDATDWAQFAEVSTYGVTHFTADGHLVVGAEPAAAWHDVSRYFAAKLPAADLRALVAALGHDAAFPAGPDLAGVAETLIAHELAHLIAAQAGAAFGRRCLAEAFANYAQVAVLGANDSVGLRRVSTLAEAALMLADATPTLREFDEGEGVLDPVSSVLAQLALTRSVFIAYAAAGDQPLARWFAIACADGGRKADPDADHELGRLLTQDVHPAIGHLALHAAEWRLPAAAA